MTSTHFNFYNEEDKGTWGWLTANSLNASKITQKTANERGYAKIFILYVVKGVTYTNYKIKLMVLEGDYTLDTVPEYIEYQDQTAIMPVQQELLENDYIADVEHHEWGKLSLDGNEEIIKDSRLSNDNRSVFFIKANDIYSYANASSIPDILSNQFKAVSQSSTWKKWRYINE